MADKIVQHRHKLSFLQGLTLIFITLKLTHVIAWSWWWVLSPFLFPFFIVLAIGILLLFVGLFALAARGAVTN